MLKLISILICNEQFHMTNIFCLKHVETICKVLVLVLDSESSLQILGPGFWDPGPKSWVLVYSLVITTCDEKLLQSMTRITRVVVIAKCDRKSLQCDGYYQV